MPATTRKPSESGTHTLCSSLQWSRDQFSTWKVPEICQRSQNLYKKCEKKLSIKKEIRRNKTNISSKFNLFVATFILFIFLCSFSEARAEHLCGNRLVSVLRHVCGPRGIYSPHPPRYYFRRRARTRPIKDVRITYLCCELECNITQLEAFCGQRPRLRPIPSKNIHLPTPPAFVTDTSTETQKTHPTFKSSTTTLTTPSESSTTHINRSDSSSFLYKLKKHNGIGVGIEEGSNKRLNLSELIRRLSSISPESSGEVEIIVPSTQYVQASLSYSSRNHY